MTVRHTVRLGIGLTLLALGLCGCAPYQTIKGAEFGKGLKDGIAAVDALGTTSAARQWAAAHDIALELEKANATEAAAKHLTDLACATAEPPQPTVARKQLDALVQDVDRMTTTPPDSLRTLASGFDTSGLQLATPPNLDVAARRHAPVANAITARDVKPCDATVREAIAMFTSKTAKMPTATPAEDDKMLHNVACVYALNLSGATASSIDWCAGTPKPADLGVSDVNLLDRNMLALLCTQDAACNGALNRPAPAGKVATESVGASDVKAIGDAIKALATNILQERWTWQQQTAMQKFMEDPSTLYWMYRNVGPCALVSKEKLPDSPEDIDTICTKVPAAAPYGSDYIEPLIRQKFAASLIPAYYDVARGVLHPDSYLKSTWDAAAALKDFDKARAMAPSARDFGLQAARSFLNARRIVAGKLNAAETDAANQAALKDFADKMQKLYKDANDLTTSLKPVTGS